MLCVMRRKSVVHISLVLTVACTTGRSELVSHYRLDEAVRDPGSVVDSVGGKDGTLINPDRVAREIYPAPFLAAYDFQPDVSLGGGVNLGTNAAVRPQANWTATWWVQLDTLNAFDRMFESMNGTAATSRGIRFDLGGSGNHVRILLRDGSGQQIPLEHTRVLSTGTWYFVAARYDTTGDATGRLTVIAEEESLGGTVVTDNTREAVNAALGAIQYQATRPTVLGVEGVAGGAVNALDGRMDDVAFFDSVLGDGQVKFVRRFGAQTLLPTTGWDAVDPGTQPATRWNSNVGTGNRCNLGGTNVPSFVDVDSRYRIPRALDITGAGLATIATNLDGREEDVSIEIWFKPRDLAGGDREVLFEAGGDSTGFSLLLEGADLVLRYDQDAVPDLDGAANHLVASHTLSSSALNDFVQAVAEIDLGRDRIELFVNGRAVANAAPPGAGTPAGDMQAWAGGSGEHVGSRVPGDATGVGGDDGTDLDAHTSFDGQIGVVRFYQGTLLSAEQVRDHYEAMQPGLGLPVPGSVFIVR